LERLVRAGAFAVAGVGTRLATSVDAPSLGGVYKLVQIEGRPVAKHSASKATYPGPHQVYRHAKEGVAAFDHLGLTEEPSFEFVDAEPLLVPVMRGGRRIHDEDLFAMRARCRSQLAAMPDAVKVVGSRTDAHDGFYEVRPSEQLVRLMRRVRDEREPTH
jgi:nicotinate phosphoribosyltransferase